MIITHSLSFCLCACDWLQEVAEILGEDGSTYQDSNIFLKGTQSANPHNDYSQHFVDTGQRSQNFIRDVGVWIIVVCTLGKNHWLNRAHSVIIGFPLQGMQLLHVMYVYVDLLLPLLIVLIEGATYM